MLTDDGLARFNPKNVCVGHQFILATLFPNTVYAATLVIAGTLGTPPSGILGGRTAACARVLGLVYCGLVRADAFSRGGFAGSSATTS